MTTALDATFEGVAATGVGGAVVADGVGGEVLLASGFMCCASGAGGGVDGTSPTLKYCMSACGDGAGAAAFGLATSGMGSFLATDAYEAAA